MAITHISVESSIQDFHKCLDQIRSDPNTINHIHPKLLCFANNKAKVNWIDYIEDLGQADTFSALTRFKSSGATHLFGLFCTWTNTWVGKDWGEMPWHNWIAIWIKGERTLYIWDCNCPDPPNDGTKPRCKDILLGAQRNLVDLMKPNIIYLGGHDQRNDEGICAQLSLTWLADAAQHQFNDTQFYQLTK